MNDRDNYKLQCKQEFKKNKYENESEKNKCKMK